MSRKYHERFEIKKVTEEGRGLRRLEFAESIKAEPGQFVKLWLPGVSERPFAVLNSDPLELGIRRFGGTFTQKVFRLYPGKKVFIRGPYGNSFMPFVKRESRKIIIAGGIGMVPLDYFARKMARHDIVVILGAKTKEELGKFFKDFKTIVATDDGSEGHKGFVTDLLEQARLNRSDQVFCCGPEAMMAKVAEIAERKVPQENIILSLERHMKCARGLCGSCDLDGYRVCVDGPVFSYDKLKGGDFGRYRRTHTGKRVRI